MAIKKIRIFAYPSLAEPQTIILNYNYMNGKKENENVMLVPSEKSFYLSKVKTLKDGGLDVHYEVTETIGNESYTNEYHVKSAKDIHPDLKRCFDRLTPIMGRIFNITSFISMVESVGFNASEEQKSTAWNFADKMLCNIEVYGVSLSGKDDNVGVVLTGLFSVSNNQKTAINSPRIKFSTESFGFEEELEKIIGDIESEVYRFLFKGKRAQLELFGADGEPAHVYTVDPELNEGSFQNMDDPLDDDCDETEDGNTDNI